METKQIKILIIEEALKETKNNSPKSVTTKQIVKEHRLNADKVKSVMERLIKQGIVDHSFTYGDGHIVAEPNGKTYEVAEDLSNLEPTQIKVENYVGSTVIKDSTIEDSTITSSINRKGESEETVENKSFISKFWYLFLLPVLIALMLLFIEYGYFAK